MDGKFVTPDTTVFFANTADIEYDTLLRPWRDQLDRDEVARLRRLRFERDRRDYLAAHVLLRLGRKQFGNDVPWSLAHTDGFAACAFGHEQAPAIGVDAEPLAAAARLEGITDVFVSLRERAWVEREPVLRGLHLVWLWTLKESYLKARGEGVVDAGGFEAMRWIECTPDGPLAERIDGWWTILVADARTGVRERGWVRSLGEHVLSVVSTIDADAPQLLRVSLP